MKSVKGMNGLIVGVISIIVGFLISMVAVGIGNNGEYLDKLGTLIMILGAIITSGFFSRLSNCTEPSKNSQN